MNQVPIGRYLEVILLNNNKKPLLNIKNAINFVFSCSFPKF